MLNIVKRTSKFADSICQLSTFTWEGKRLILRFELPHSVSSDRRGYGGKIAHRSNLPKDSLNKAILEFIMPSRRRDELHAIKTSWRASVFETRIISESTFRSSPQVCGGCLFGRMLPLMMSLKVFCVSVHRDVMCHYVVKLSEICFGSFKTCLSQKNSKLADHLFVHDKTSCSRRRIKK